MHVPKTTFFSDSRFSSLRLLLDKHKVFFAGYLASLVFSKLSLYNNNLLPATFAPAIATIAPASRAV